MIASQLAFVCLSDVTSDAVCSLLHQRLICVSYQYELTAAFALQLLHSYCSKFMHAYRCGKKEFLYLLAARPSYPSIVNSLIH